MRIDSDPRTNSQMPATALQYRGSGNCAQLNDVRGERSETLEEKEAGRPACPQVGINYPRWTQGPQQESHCGLEAVHQRAAGLEG